MQRNTESTPVDVAGASASSTAEGDGGADVEAEVQAVAELDVEVEPRPDAAVAAQPEFNDDPLPGELISDSPLDELAEVTPEIADDALEEKLELVADGPTTFDIPMVTNDKVMFWVDYYANRHPASFQPALARGGRYLEMFREIFEQEGLPTDLVYMAHVESAYKTSAYSRARARGLWQFISGTGRRYGLRIDYWVDERVDPVKSTRAAAAYLKDLYAEFGDWYLALAGYNAGEGKIRRAIRSTGSRDFWVIARSRYIRRETKNYVPAILAATLISKEPQKYGFDFVPDDPIRFETIEVEGAADLRVLADCAGTDFETMRQLNPSLRRQQTPPAATTTVNVPPGSAESALAALREVPQDERVLYARHRVQQGDTLSGLASEYGVSVAAIQTANGMGRRTMIRAGKELVIPTVAARNSTTVAAKAPMIEATDGSYLIYRVRLGDNLYDIAQHHDTTPNAIAAVSGIHVRDLLHPGDRLKVVPGARSSGEARRIAANAQVATANPVGGGGGTGPMVHTVRRGDTLWDIANAYRTTVDDLCTLNRISRSGTLRPGTKLTVKSD